MLNPVPAVSRYCSSSKKPYSLVTSVNFTRYASVNTAIHRGIRRTQRGSLRGSRKEYPRHQRGDSRPRRSSPPGFNLQNGLSSVTSLHRFRDPDQPRRPNHVLGLDGDDVSPSAGFRAPGRFVKHNPSRNDRIEPSWTLSRARSFGRFSGTGRPSSFPTPLEERRGRHRRRQASQKGYTPIEQETAPSSFSPTNMIRRQRGILHHAPHGDAPVTRERESSGWSPRHHEPPWFLKHQSEQPVPYAAEDPSVRDSFGSSAPLRSRRWEDDDRLDDRSRRESRIPLSIPYTTPASEFLYGTAAVTAALRSQRRKLYKLYVYEGENREARSRDDTVRTLARNAGVEVVGVQGDWIRLMDKMATGRPHNGYILEASPLPKLPVKGLARTSVSSKAFEVRIGHQSKEEQAVNGTDRSIPYSGHVFPFVLMLDGVLDPGNLGAIVRSAFFLGVDAIAISERNSAPLSPAMLKASAGASEHVPLLSVSHPAAFLDESSSNGWRIYAGVAPTTSSSRPSRQSGRQLSLPDLTPPLNHHPAVLILGGEGEGLRANLRKKANYEVGIPSGRHDQGEVDSLNVSVASALLCHAFLARTPRVEQARPDRHVAEQRLF